MGHRVSWGMCEVKNNSLISDHFMKQEPIVVHTRSSPVEKHSIDPIDCFDRVIETSLVVER